MKRDMDLIRNLLYEIERLLPEKSWREHEQFNETTPDEENYQLVLLTEAGLIHAMDNQGINDSLPQMWPLRLTWKGHEFLEASRSDTIWSQAKDAVMKNTGGMAFDLLFSCLKQLGTKALQGDNGG